MLPLLLLAQALSMNPTALPWTAVNDTVMGGVSSSAVQVDDTVQFTGTLSLEQNGGFTSMRAPLPPGALQNARALRMTLRGDGRRYELTLRRSDVPLRAGSYRVYVDTQAEGETVVELPLADFRPTSFGRSVAGAPALDAAPDRVNVIGVLLADKQPGPFSLELLSLESVPGRSARGPGHGDLVVGLQGAVSAGVPRFNAGDTAGCAEIYTQALNQIRAHPALTPGERAVVEEALAAAADQSSTDAAWTLRGAIDTVLASS